MSSNSIGISVLIRLNIFAELLSDVTNITCTIRVIDADENLTEGKS